MEIYLVRHGETYWNEKRLLQGHADIELNEKGRQLAGEAGEKLDNIHFDVIYSSPLIRAYETACLIRGHRNIPIVRDERLKEICFGENEGQDSKLLFQDETNPFHYFFTNPELFEPVTGGESFDDVCARTSAFMKELIEPLEKQHERIMIAGHGAMNKAIERHMTRCDLKDYWSVGLQANCGILIATLEDGVYNIKDYGTGMKSL